MVSSSPWRRYLQWLGSAMAVYVVSLFVAKYLISRHLMDGPIVWVLGWVPRLFHT